MVSTIQSSVSDYLMDKPLAKPDVSELSIQEWEAVIENAIHRHLTLKYLRGLSSLNEILGNRSGVRAIPTELPPADKVSGKKLKPNEGFLECVSISPPPRKYKEWPTGERPTKISLMDRIPLPITERILLLRRKKEGHHEFAMITVVWTLKDEWDDSRSVAHLTDWWLEGHTISFEATSLAEFLELLELAEEKVNICKSILQSLFAAQAETASDLESLRANARRGQRALEKLLWKL